MNIKYTKENIEKAILKSKAWTDVCRILGVKPNTGSQSNLQRRAKQYGIEQPKHFTGRAWNKGMSLKRKDALEYCYKGSKEGSHKLKNKLIRDNYKKAECELCKLTEWLGEPIVLELDHIDSDHFNNEFSNLQILCSNCHALKTRKSRKASVVK